MGLQTQITRLETLRNSIRAKLVELGLVASTAKLEDCSTALSSIENRGNVSVTVKEGESYTIPKGYHNGAGTVSGVAGGGNYNLQSKSVTPTKAQQQITPDDGSYGLSDVTVESIPDNYQDVSSVTAQKGEVLLGKIFVDAKGASQVGTMKNNGDVSATINGLVTTSVTIPEGYTTGGTISLTNDIENALADI